MVRKVLECVDEDEIKLFINDILGPHKSYYSHLKKLYENDIYINASAHITGGGVISNLKRVIPDGLNFKIIKSTILENLPPCMNFIKIKGNLTNEELFSTFNCGIGFTIIINKEDKNKIFELFGKDILEIGYVY